MRTMTLAVSTAMLFSVAAFAQKVEISGDYSFLQFNPTISGLQSRAYNGGGGGFQYNVTPHFGVKGDFQGYGSTEWTVNVTAPIGTPDGGIIPIGTYTTKANMFTYLFGPVASAQKGKARFFGEVLLGGSNTSAYANLSNPTIIGGSMSSNPSQHPFTMAVGGGLDINVNDRVAIRLGEVDWMLTRYTNPFTDTNNQNSFRYLGGIIIRFGK